MLAQVGYSPIQSIQAVGFGNDTQQDAIEQAMAKKIKTAKDVEAYTKKLISQLQDKKTAAEKTALINQMASVLKIVGERGVTEATTAYTKKNNFAFVEGMDLVKTSYSSALNAQKVIIDFLLKQ